MSSMLLKEHIFYPVFIAHNQKIGVSGFLNEMISSSSCLMGRFPEEVGSFEECAHGGRGLSCRDKDDYGEFFRRAAVDRLTVQSSMIKGLCLTETIFSGEIR